MSCMGLSDLMRRAPAALVMIALAIAPVVPALARPPGLMSLPWSDPASETARGTAPVGTTVTFTSHSPFTLSDVGAGAEADPPAQATGTLFMPKNASAAAPVPAVIMLHGAAGVLASRELTYGRQLASMGIAALVIDAFAARRDMARGFIDRLLNITEAMLLADAYAGLRYLGERPDVDGSRVVLIGFSYGGMATLYAAYATVAERYAPDGHRFAGHVAYYAPCIASFSDSRATGAPVLMMYGEEDAIVDPGRCAAVAEELEAGGSEVGIVAFDGAYHQWDGRFSVPREIGRSLASCRYVVERDGTVRDARILVPLSSPFLRKISLGLCAESAGYMIGRDDHIRQLSNRELAHFLSRVFAPSGPDTEE